MHLAKSPCLQMWFKMLVQNPAGDVLEDKCQTQGPGDINGLLKTLIWPTKCVDFDLLTIFSQDL